MKRKKDIKARRDLEAERLQLLAAMSLHISKDTRQKIAVAIKVMNKIDEPRITISHTGAGNADHQ